MSDLDVSRVTAALQERADPERARQMARYMQDRFVFYGVAAPVRRRATAATRTAAARATGDELIAFARACWARPEREVQYVGTDALASNADTLGAEHLADLEFLVSTKSWWDTVDALAAWNIGSLVSRYPALAAVMDEWIRSDDIWIARAAILHQLRYGERTDAERLFGFADLRAGDSEFFIRKALGWALRQYARTDPDAVRAYVAANEHRLSGLTRREALKHLPR